MNRLFPQAASPVLSTQKKPSHEEGLRIAMSGLSGCGNSTVSALLAKKLDLVQANYTFRDLAKTLNLDMDEIAARAKTDESIDWHLDTTLAEKARIPRVVLASRLAVWLLPNAHLRVYLQSSLEVRARRIQHREGGTLADIQHKTELRDRHDHRRYQRLYQVDITDVSFVDLVIDAALWSPPEIVEQIVGALNSTSKSLRADTR